jgi:dCMP deaminase
VGIKLKYIKYFATIAEETARLSSALKLKVGCVIVKDNRILSVGYNGTPSGWDNTCEHNIHHHELGTTTSVTKAEVIHAEANALMKICTSTESSKGASLFVTHFPCVHCAKLIYQAGISEVYYINDYNATIGSGHEFLSKTDIKVTHTFGSDPAWLWGEGL